MEYYLTACNYMTTFSFITVGGISAFTYIKNFHDIVVPFQIEYATLTTNETDLLYFLGFFSFINILIRVAINRYPLRIYRKEKQYLAMFEGKIPLTYKKLKFYQGDVVPVPPGGMLPWQESRYKIKDKHVLLLDEYFRSPSELNTMMIRNKTVKKSSNTL
ncbi:uncharacterized protein LOC131214271 isoform X1 [Anopheles bellator]|uniref:uncharacterized protein LOC131214271 isoform X1 n=1 Tax=Anopheles bellator TaxID=139047 RepID=UPI002648D51D|nr:uncharacterized protein LOC131214271 isoform X1 [Anopheles bellator]XP_058064634.1 uncharacterized protein LOC131214271 isoform X1 [Anopheles bellator]